ncbi:MAG: C25 family cysteine peptidase [Planctomycetota bacterium]
MRVPLVLVACVAGMLSTAVHAADRAGTVRVRIDAAPYRIEETARGQEIRMEGFGCVPVPGVPALPARIFAVAVPPGATVTGVSFVAEEAIALDGSYAIPPVPLPVPVSQMGGGSSAARPLDARAYEAARRAAYEGDAFWPAEPGEAVRTARYRKYELVDVRILPFAWHPRTGELLLHPSVTVNVRYTLPEEPPPPVVDHLRRPEELARRIVANYDEAQAWYGGSARAGRGLYDFVIVTMDSLVGAVQPIVDRETVKGRHVNVVTTSWIYANYGGYDAAEQVRNFLREKYPSSEWGIEDALLVGHHAHVPMRRCTTSLEQPRTDFYFAELSLPDDQSWDADGDRLWGEEGEPIDFYSEINTGRIPWSDPTIVQDIGAKSVAYEQDNDPAFKRHGLLLGSFITPETDTAVMMELKSDPAWNPWMADWSTTKLYEQNADYWSAYTCDRPLNHANVMTEWPGGKYSFVNWGGHGSPSSCHIYGQGAPAFITSSDAASLDHDHRSIIFAFACSNSDTDYTNIGQVMLRHAAVGFVGATKFAYGVVGWGHPNGGCGQSMDYYFSTAVTSSGNTPGEALQSALRTMYTHGLWFASLYYETFIWSSLWGHPGLTMFDPRADFAGGPRTGEMPLAVSFADASVGTGLLAWSWDFGDGGTASEQHPTHVYDFPGTYTVSLTVLGSYGADTATKVDYVVVSGTGARSRNGSGVNPAVFTSTSLPYLGTTWTSEIDGGAVGASGLTFVVGYSGPLAGLLTAFGELLIDVSTAWVVTHIAPGASGISHHAIPIPSDPAFAGFAVYTQGFLNRVAGGSGQLTNAIDLVLGT